jgi:hypothetical protein
MWVSDPAVRSVQGLNQSMQPVQDFLSQAFNFLISVLLLFTNFKGCCIKIRWHDARIVDGQNLAVGILRAFLRPCFQLQASDFHT